MNKIYKYLEGKVYYLATSSINGSPRVRPFATIYYYKDNLYILTKSSKNVGIEILKNKQISISTMSNDGSFIIIQCCVVKCLDNLIIKRICNKYKEYHYNCDSEDTLVLKLTNGIATIYNEDRTKSEIIIA
ncbi:MAG: pyridoxamine 5'-phosphate oxidase family protein [Mycoplasmataceae bacterium]|nr:pyridoxamine 5'-phosphate oxidase family protein [Mycoplasmataceae bacterium]